MITETEKIWFDGRLVDWKEAQIHVLTHTLHYGLGVFEGIRCYKTPQGPAVFRLEEHVDRLLRSAHIMQMALPYSREQILEAVVETVRANRLESGYIRPIAFIGYGSMGLYVEENPVHLVIAAWPWGTYLGKEGLEQGIRVKISSFSRFSVNSVLHRAKVTGYYVNSILAKKEAKALGFDEALLLDTEGFLAEGSGENLFVVRRGTLLTPPLTAVLEGITRDTIMTLARETGIPVREARLTRDDLYLAEEAFLTGTAAEITPIREADHRVIGEGRPGPITRALQQRFFEIVQGRDPSHAQWLTWVFK